MRKAIPKNIRQQVYEKYNGHCAYCGCKLEYKDMQVDHIESIYKAEYNSREAANTIENYMPSCRSCNFYKGVYSIDQLHKDFNYKMLIKYGMIQEDFKPVQFYFEKKDVYCCELIKEMGDNPENMLALDGKCIGYQISNDNNIPAYKCYGCKYNQFHKENEK